MTLLQVVSCKFSIRLFACVLAVVWAAVGLVVDTTANEPRRPNMLILVGDDIDRDSLGPWGGQAKTPNLDQLARDGIRFDNVFANVAMCAPFRQELYSGRCAWRTRAMPNHSRSVRGTESLPHYLRPLGYRVALLGKSHVGPKAAYPFEILGKLPMKEDPNPKALKIAREFVADAKAKDQPFCLVVASHDGHAPFTHGDVGAYEQEALKLNSDEIDTPEFRAELTKHLAEVSNLDALLGDLRTMLADEDLTDNTLVMFCSEQGNQFPFSKWTCFNDGLASGVVVSLPGVIPRGETCDQIAWIADFAPTLLEAAGGSQESGVSDRFDGKSQWGNFLGGNLAVHQYAYGAFCNCNILDNRSRVFPTRSVRDQRYSLIWSPRRDQEITSNVTLTQALELMQNNREIEKPNVAASWLIKSLQKNNPKHRMLVDRFHHRPEWALYDRQTDPEELKNLINDPSLHQNAKRMKGALMDWLSRWGDADPTVTERNFVK